MTGADGTGPPQASGQTFSLEPACSCRHQQIGPIKDKHQTSGGGVPSKDAEIRKDRAFPLRAQRGNADPFWVGEPDVALRGALRSREPDRAYREVMDRGSEPRQRLGRRESLWPGLAIVARPSPGGHAAL
jgi:hypothetical protein